MRTPNVLALGALAGALLAPAVASACGGFFCNATPVDQQAERIIFVQEDADTVTSYVEINYQGDPAGFAWVVPVPAVPELDVWFSGAFNALDLATQPQFNVPWGCFLEADAAAGGPPNADDDGVDVLAQERVGPFDTATIQSEDPRALVEWLRVNEYRITPAMEPFIAMYTEEGMKFLAMKLAPGEDTASIRPIKMTYTAAGPAVPLRLTAVAAQLEMGVKVWILGEGRYGPLNVPDVEIPDADLKWDFNRWQSNYLPLVARKVDDLGGRGFVTELAGPTAPLAETVRNSFIPDFAGEEAEEARDALVALLESRPYISRLYTRVSPEEMDIDPMFGPVDGGDVSNIHEVPPPEEGADECNWDGPLDAAAEACDFVACGAGGICADVEPGVAPRQAGCGCAPGTVARAGMGPDGLLEVACADVRLNFTAPDLDPGNLAFVDVCDQGDFCGEGGECVMLNGFPSCRCDVGLVAVPTIDEMGMPVPTCVAPTTPLAADVFAPVVLKEPNLPYPGRQTPMEPDPTPDMPDDNRGGGTAAPDVLGCTAAPGSRDDAPPFWLALPLLGLALRRRH